MLKHTVRLGIYIFMTLCCMLIIFIFSSQNAAASQALSDGLLVRILDLFRVQQYMERYEILIRKLAHFFLFFALGMSSVLMFSQLRHMDKLKFSARLSAFVFSAAYAASDEIHQYFVPGRSMQFSDVLLDSAGALTAIILFSAVRKLIFRLREERMEHEQTSSAKKE